MLRHHLYYLLKPYIPWRVRNALRGMIQRRERENHRDVWPIRESAGKKPANWPGWPDGKKFAIVLTHDVEGPAGLAKCRKLMQLETDLGFRSTFGLIPEGDYVVPPDLREEMIRRKFGVAIHDLNHDGKLYGSRRIFSEKAQRINAYVREWGASGFRAGFMFHNLDWLHDLDIDHDSSTFDTDPFEPQSDGVNTIFPFWVPSPQPRQVHRKDGWGPVDGYVEIPYTLPQDSTLFLVLREKSPEIWLRKLDWIAANGGMALVNVHPDYLCFDGEKPSASTYSVKHYTDLLNHLRHRYAGQYVNPLLSEVAGLVKEARRSAPSSASATAPQSETGPARTPETPVNLRGKRAAVLLYSYYPADPRPRRAAESMVEAGMTVDLFCLSESEDDPPQETIAGVHVHRTPLKRQRGSKLAYFTQYGRFLLSSFWFLTKQGLRQKYDVVHVHNMPDFLVFAALVPKLRGARVILDLHDPMPELLVAIYKLKPDQWLVRFLRLLERMSIGFANLALTPNIAFKRIFSARSSPRPEKIQIVMNSPQEELFDPDRFGAGRDGPPENGEFRIMHHGSIVHRHGVDVLVEAVALLRPKIPSIVLDIYGSRTAFIDTVLARAAELGIADVVHYHGPKTQAEIAVAIRHCHLGVVPNRRSAFTETNFPTRLFEYLAMHRPVVAPSTEGIHDYFTGEQMMYFEPGDVADLAAKILWVREHPAETRTFVDQGRKVYRQHLWSREKAHFLQVVSGLFPRT
ncbi:MAG: glycosyltransferase [Verrucomicrobia bacterium]|nr:glycosyltransferase [Verrucomicrobiota bacterium]